MDDKELIEKGYKPLIGFTGAWLPLEGEIYRQARKINKTNKKAYFVPWEDSSNNNKRCKLYDDEGKQKQVYRNQLLEQYFDIPQVLSKVKVDIPKVKVDIPKVKEQKPWKERLSEIKEKFKGKGGCNLNMGKSFADYLS